MKIRVDRSARIGSLANILFGIFLLIMGIMMVYQNPDAIAYGVVVFFCVVIVVGIIILIINELNYIWIDGNGIVLYHLNKKKKALKLDNVKCIIICQIMFHGVKNQSIVLDDGTFHYRKFTKNDLFTKKTRDNESWIAIEYSKKRFAIIKKMLPNCPIETIAPDQY